MNRLAVYGWSDDMLPLLQALREEAALEPVAIGDERPAALVRARGATGLACFQHVHEMTRAADFDVVLVGPGAYAADVAEASAVRGADVIVVGAEATASTLARAAEAAARYGVAFGVFRPWLRSAGLSFARARLAAEANSDFLVLNTWDPRAAMGLLRDAVALLTRISGARVVAVAASSTRPSDYPSAVALQLRLDGGLVAAFTAQTADEARVQLHASGSAGALDLESRDGCATVTVVDASAECERFTLEDTNALAAEARRLVEVRTGDHTDLLLAPREASVLAAVEQALEGEIGQRLPEPERPVLRMLRGRGTGAGSPQARPSLSIVSTRD